MKEVVIKSSTAPAKPRSEKYPIGTTIVKTSSGTTVINTTGGSSIDVIKTDEIKTPTDSNVLSALRSLTEFISKNKDSDVSAVLNYLQGLKIDGKQLSRLISENEDAGELLDTDVMSALRVISEIGGNNEALKNMFLRKDQEDVAAKHISFEDGIDVKNGISTDSLTASNGVDVKNGVTTDTLSASANVSSPTATISDKTTTLNLLVQAVADIYDLNVSHVATLFRTTIKDYISSELYTSGLTGSGMKLYKALNGDWNLELDNVVIRKAMTVFELIISKIRAVNGGLVISPANGKVKSVLLTNGIYRLEIEGDMMFVADDLVRCQTFTKTGSKYYWVRITSVSGAYVFINATEFTTSLPAAGDDLVQFGNKTNALRQGIIYLTASEDGKPRISVLDGVNSTALTGKTKAILGCLDGVVDSDFPADHQPSGYGLYAQNVFLKGLFVLRNGKSVESEITATNDAVQTAQSVADAAQTAANNAQTEAEKVRTEYTSDFSILSGKVESKVSQTDFNALGNRVSSAESSITQLPNQIALSVTESKQYTDGKVDSVEVGGVNLVRNSNSDNFASYSGSVIESQTTGVSVPEWGATDANRVIVTGGTTDLVAFKTLMSPLIKGSIFSQSGYFKNNSAAPIIISMNAGERRVTISPGEAKRIVYEGNVQPSSTAHIQFQIRSSDVGVGVDFTWWRFKVEYGNKATYWTAAPEDVDAEISTAKSAASAAQSTANQAKTDAATAQTTANNAKTEAEKVRTEYKSDFSVLSGKVESKVSQTDFNALGNRVSSAESSITQLPNQIALSVTESKQYTDGKVDSVQVGGRNLLPNSDFSKTDLSRWYKSFDGNYTISIDNGELMVVGTQARTPSELNSWNTTWYVYPYAFNEESEYTLSFEAYALVECVLYCRANYFTYPVNGGSAEIGTTKKKYSIVFKNKPYDGNRLLGFVFSKATTLFIDNVKLEIGNKATDWSPAPEDVDAEINKRPTTDQIKAEFTIDPTGISMLGKKIALTGMVTFTALDASAQATINSKVTGNDIATKLGYSNYTDMIDKAAAGQTIINGGYIRTSLIDADSLITNTLLSTKIAATDITTKRLTVDEGCKVGGFSIGSGRIGSIASATGDGGELAIYSDFFRVGGSSGYAMLGNNVMPATTGGAFNATGRIVNKTVNQGASWGFDACNMGLYISVVGGTKNFGIDSDAPLKAPAFINTKYANINFSGSSYTIDFSQANVFRFFAYSNSSVNLPTASQLARQFSMSSLPSDFAYACDIFIGAGSSTITLNNIYNNDHDLTTLTMNKGDAVRLLITNVGGTLIYKVLSVYF